MNDLIDRIKSIGTDYVLVCKTAVGKDCGGGKRGLLNADGTPLLVFDDNYAQTTNFVEIVDVGPSCKWFKPEHAYWRNGKDSGDTTFSPEMGDGLHWIDQTYWVIKENMLLPVLFREIGPVAIGHYVVIEVPTGKDESQMIVTTERYNDPCYFGTVVSVGELVVEPLKVGQRILRPKDLFTFDVNGKRYACIAEDTILGIEEGESA